MEDGKHPVTIFHPLSSIFSIMDRDRALGALLGAAVGDALGMPVDGLSHQNVRLYYRGIKGYTADEKRGDPGSGPGQALRAGQWTAHTQRTFALARAIASEPRAADYTWSARAAERFEHARTAEPLRRAEAPPWGTGVTAAACAVPLGVWARASGASSERRGAFARAALGKHTTSVPALAAALGMAEAVRLALDAGPGTLDGTAFLADVRAVVAGFENESGAGTPVADRLAALAPHLDETPLDLQDRCNGTGAAADEAFPFAVAMFARNPALVEATLLSAVNVGGAASAVGAMVGALLGAFNGWRAFPAEWREGLEDVERLEVEAAALVHALS
jgi:ADP-ribosylglycohydrolase